MSPARASEVRPEIDVPPPVYYVAGLLAGSILSYYYPTRWIPNRIAFVAGVALIAASLGMGLSALWVFWRARTTVLPYRPASQLVVHGVYKITRNPMYVGMAMLYAGIAALIQSVWSVLLLPIVLIAVDRRVIRREEKHLHDRFGHDYHRYTQAVRRWL